MIQLPYPSTIEARPRNVTFLMAQRVAWHRMAAQNVKSKFYHVLVQ